MNLLILGAGGMVGHVATIRLKELGHNVTGFARKKFTFCETIIGDAMKVDWSEIVRGYDAVVNCIGILNKAVDADSYKGIYLNACLPHLLAKYAKRVIHISSDCVFSGHDNGSYKENDFRSTDTMYGRTKALGEINDNNNFTIRTSIVGPDINENGIGLFNWFMKQQELAKGYTNAIWSGVTTLVFAEAVNEALKQNTTGLYHLTNGEKISKFKLLKLFNELRTKPIGIEPYEGVKEDRSLICTRKDFSFQVPTYGNMMKSIGKWITDYKELYPKYIVQGVK